MDKTDFNRLVQSPEAASETEAQGVLSLKEDYPFSQLLHALSARVSKDHGFSSQQQELQLAAVYASDRNVLKDIVTGNFTPFVSSPVITESLQTAETVPAEVEIPVSKPAETSEKVPVKKSVEKSGIKITSAKDRKIIEPLNLDTAAVADEVFSDLKKLNQSRHNFEALFNSNEAEQESTTVPVEDSVKEKPQEKKESKPKKTAKRKPPIRKKATGKTKKQRIIELAQKLEQEQIAQTEETETKETDAKKKAAPKKGKKKVVEPVDQLIDEIKTSKKKIHPENHRQKEQIELINQFIKAQPSISPQKGKTVPPANVDFSMKSSEFGDNIISETLVKILLSQGKKDKAVEVLRKLIWKFPQKKSYFAAQIEELTK